MERPPQRYFCNKCGYVGSSDTHPGCNYFAYPMAHLEQLYIDHLEAELEALRASPASAPEGFNHSVGAERFTIIRGAFWWHVRAGDGTQNIGKFHTRLAAKDMASTMLTAFRDGAFVQYQAMLAVAPTPPEVSENQKDGERYRWLRSSSTGPSQIWELLSDECNPPILTLKSMGDLDAAIDQAMQEDKP